MKISDLLSMCMRNLIRRKFRTFLTVTGVVIGTTSIIMMISLGIGISTQLDEQIKMWGDLTMINVYGGGGSESSIKLDDETIAKMQAIPGVDVATPFLYLRMNSSPMVYAGTGFRYLDRWPSVYGVYPEALEKMGYTIQAGSTLPSGKAKEIRGVIGGEFVYEFEDTRKKVNNRRNNWPDENGNIDEPFFEPMKTKFKIVLPPGDNGSGTSSARNLEYELDVVGVLESDRSKGETVWGLFMSIDDVNRLQADFNKENGIKTSKNDKPVYQDVRVKALHIDKVTEIEDAIKEMGFGTDSRQRDRENTQKSMRQMQIILGGIGAITLLVSAISITNTMIMSVYERTREIGVMKVLGCLVGNIRSIFLLEAGIIGFFGGIVGIVLSFLLSFLLNTFGSSFTGGDGGFGNILGRFGMGGGSQISIIPPWLVLLGLAFATGIGLVSGFYPADRAVRISALEAIKQE